MLRERAQAFKMDLQMQAATLMACFKFQVGPVAPSLTGLPGNNWRFIKFSSLGQLYIVCNITLHGSNRNHSFP